MKKVTNKIALLIIMHLFIIAVAITILLFFSLTNVQTRPQTFGFTIVFVCFLEALCFGYFVPLFAPALRKRVIIALYPTLSVIVAAYIVLSLIAILALSSYTMAYYIVIAIISFVFLVVSGAFIILNAFKKTEDVVMEKEKKETTDLLVSAQDIHQKFLNCKKNIETDTYREIEHSIRKMKERFQHCTPFGKDDVRIAEIETQIKENIELLDRYIAEISSIPKEETVDML